MVAAGDSAGAARIFLVGDTLAAKAAGAIH
jgi:hypothetical protein